MRMRVVRMRGARRNARPRQTAFGGGGRRPLCGARRRSAWPHLRIARLAPERRDPGTTASAARRQLLWMGGYGCMLTGIDTSATPPLHRVGERCRLTLDSVAFRLVRFFFAAPAPRPTASDIPGSAERTSARCMAANALDKERQQALPRLTLLLQGRGRNILAERLERAGQLLVLDASFAEQVAHEGAGFTLPKRWRRRFCFLLNSHADKAKETGLPSSTNPHAWGFLATSRLGCRRCVVVVYVGNRMLTRKHPGVVTSSSYSGQWVKRCACQ